MVKDKMIAFRVSKEEYNKLMEDKPKYKSLSEHIRELILWGSLSLRQLKMIITVV